MSCHVMLKINHLALITTHDEFDSADPSNMQDACNMNLQVYLKPTTIKPTMEPVNN